MSTTKPSIETESSGKTSYWSRLVSPWARFREYRRQRAETSESQPWTFKQFQIIALVFSLFIVDGIDSHMLALAVPALAETWELTAADFRLAVSSGFLGIALGASIGGVLSDKYGRRPMILVLAFLFGPTTLAMATANEPNDFILLRFIAGLGLGGCMAPALTLLTESVQSARCGIVVSLAMLAAPLGSTFAGMLAAFVIPVLGWQSIFVIGGILALVMATILTLFLPESPVFLARHPDRKDKLEKLVAKLGIDMPEPSRPKTEEKSSKPATSILAPNIRWVTAGILIAFLFAYVAGGIVMGWLPTFLREHGYSLSDASLSLSVWSICGIVGSLTIGVILARRSAWNVVKALIFLAIVCSLLLAVIFHMPGTPSRLVSFSLIGISGALSSALVILLFACAAQTFPDDIRASGIGFSATSGRVGGFAGAMGGASLLVYQGGLWFFICYAVSLAVVLAGLMLAKKHLPEQVPS